MSLSSHASSRQRASSHTAAVLATVLATLAASLVALVLPARSAHAATTYPMSLSSSQLNLGFASDGSVQSLKVANDLYDTQYVMNPDVAPDQGNETNAKYKQWLGNLMFSYALGSGAVSQSGVGSSPWQTAWTTESSDARTVTSTSSGVNVTYANSTAADGIKNFTLNEGYSLATDGSLTWTQTVTNTSGQNMTIGDWGVPLPTNELWKQGDEIYETRVLSHSYVGRNGSYVTVGRPSGLGPYLMVSADDATGSGFEYQDRWRTEEVGNTSWAWNENNEGSNVRGLNVYYVHSEAIQKTNRGYLGSTALTLANGQSKTYTFHISKVASNDDVKQTLYNEGLLDTTVVPGMVVPYDQSAQAAFRVKGTITSVVARNMNDLKASSPQNPVVTFDHANGAYQIYKIGFAKSELGNNQVTVTYKDAAGATRQSVLQFDVVDSAADAINMHASFMVNKMQWTTADGLASTDIRLNTYDDWLMNARDGSDPGASGTPAGRRNSYAGGYGLGDDWGLTHGDFLAAKESILPVKSEVQSLDNYVETAVWEHLMGNTATSTNPSYLVYDWWEQGKPGSLNDTGSGRGFAYPHIYNTFFGMYQVAKQYPTLITYQHPATWYLNNAYQVFKELYDGPVGYNYYTGLMGEQTTPALVKALLAEGMIVQADDILSKMDAKYANFKSEAYPYGSEYSYDNTGEEAVYTLARMHLSTDTTNALRIMSAIASKTQAARGQMPTWYWYADPTTITGDNWWQFQYSTALAGYGLDDYINHTSALETGANAVTNTSRAELERLNYAAKSALLSSINDGQISTNPANIGASAWSYQSEKGNLGTSGVGGGYDVAPLNGWRGMTGESDLGLWGMLQTLSADVVTDDPIFGTVAYGATVTSDPYSYTVLPTDGLSRRLNMVSQQLSVALNADQYVGAIVSKTNNDLNLNIRNTTGTTHAGSFTVSGMKQGTYAVVVNGAAQGKVNIYTPPTGAASTVLSTLVTYTLPASSNSSVQLVAATPDANTAPTVNAGTNQTGLRFNVDAIQLSGSATDDGLGSPNGTLTTTWSVKSAPTGTTATFSDPSSLYPTATVSAAGTYVFTLTGRDGALSSTSDVTINVVPLAPLPSRWVDYTFDTHSGTSVPDTTGNNNTLTLQGSATTVTDGSSPVLSLDGTPTSYAQLPADILTRSSSVTISSWVKLKSISTFSRIFDFGNNTQHYAFLTPAGGNGNLYFGVTKSGNGNESSITTNYTFPTNVWRFVRLSIVPNAGATTYTGTLWVNGVQVGQNTAMAVAPKDIGPTAGDYLGKSQFGDPTLNGELDDFRIDGVADDTSPTATVRVTGSGTVGFTLSATATADPSDSNLAYQWLRDGAAIAGATSSTYTVSRTDRGHSLSVSVTATKNTYNGPAATSASTAVSQVSMTVSPRRGSVGSVATATGRGYSASVPVTVRFDATTVATAVTSKRGTFSVTFNTPPADRGTSHSISATDGNATASMTYTVTR